MPSANLTQDEWTSIANAVSKEVTSAQRAQKTGKTPHIIQVYKVHEQVLKELEAKCLKLANTPDK